MSSATYFDIILTIPLLWGIYRGFCKGFIIELASLIALALGVYGGIKFSGYTSALLQENSGLNNQYLPVISFAVTFILLVIGVHLLAKLIETFVNIASLKLVNKIAGALFGLFKAGLIIFILLFILKATDEKLKWLPVDLKTESYFYRASERIPFNGSGIGDLEPGKIISLP